MCLPHCQNRLLHQTFQLPESEVLNGKMSWSLVHYTIIPVHSMPFVYGKSTFLKYDGKELIVIYISCHSLNCSQYRVSVINLKNAIKGSFADVYGWEHGTARLLFNSNFGIKMKNKKDEFKLEYMQRRFTRLYEGYMILGKERMLYKNRLNIWACLTWKNEWPKGQLYWEMGHMRH